MPQLLKENEVSYYLGEKHIYPKVEGGGSSTIGLPIVTKLASETTATLDPDKCYIWQGNPASLNISLATPSDNTVTHEYWFIFESGSTATNISLPNGLLWDSNIDTTSQFIEADTTYEFHICNGIVRVGGAV